MTKYLTLVLTLLLFCFYGNMCYDGFFNALKISNFKVTLVSHFSKQFSINFLVLSELANCYIYFTILKNLGPIHFYFEIYFI